MRSVEGRELRMSCHRVLSRSARSADGGREDHRSRIVQQGRNDVVARIGQSGEHRQVGSVARKSIVAKIVSTVGILRFW